MQDIITDMMIDEYHDDRAIGASGLKLFARSPAHYWAEYLDPGRKRRDTATLRRGRAWHCALFEPDEFALRYTANHDAHHASKRAMLLDSVLSGELRADRLVAMPGGVSATSKAGRELTAQAEADGLTMCAPDELDFVREWYPRLRGREVMPPSQIDAVLRAASIARQLPVSRVVFGKLADYGLAEASMFSDDPASGVRIKVRPDYAVRPCEQFPAGLVIDGKSTTDAGTGFGRQVWSLDYGLQAALYTRVFQQRHQTAERPMFLWLAQEMESPFAARYYAAGTDLLEYWDRRIDDLLGRVAECQRTNCWPAYPDAVETLALPAWAQKQIDEEADE
jgi:hypothetical protein